jgi:transcription elongation factor GreA
MSPAPSAADLLRSIGLEVDGPLRWGGQPATRKPGIFAVELPEPSEHCSIDIDEVRRWLERVPDLKMDGERPTQSTLAERMRRFWVPNQQLVYVGRTAKSLSARVASLYATELGHARPHPGGHWLKVLRDLPQLRLWWAETDAPEEYEDVLIEAFALSVSEEDRAGLPDGAPLLPWANLDSPTTASRETGLTDTLLAVDATPVKRPAVKRSDSRGQRRRAATTSTSPRSPRRSTTAPIGGNAAATAAARTSKKDAPTPVTREGLAAMQTELRELIDVQRPEVVTRVASARELGDLRENADYEAARNEQSFLEGRILELQQKLRTAVVIQSQAGGAIGMGSTVVYEIDGQREELKIVGSTESDPGVGKISSASPVGRALLGHREGDDVSVVTPAARFTYTVIKVK